MYMNNLHFLWGKVQFITIFSKCSNRVNFLLEDSKYNILKILFFLSINDLKQFYDSYCFIFLMLFWSKKIQNVFGWGEGGGEGGRLLTLIMAWLRNHNCATTSANQNWNDYCSDIFWPNIQSYIKSCTYMKLISDWKGIS